MLRPTLAAFGVFTVCAAWLVPAAQAQARNILGIDKAPLSATIPADRPGFGDNTTLVPAGYFVFEAGYRFDDNAGGGSTYTVPDLLLRSGLDENLELRLGFGGYAINAPGPDGINNASVGLKIDALDEGRWTPELAVIPQVTLPTGDDDVAADTTEPEVRFAWSKGLTANTGISGNLNFVGRADRNGRRNLETAVSVAGGYSLAPRLGSYVEYYTIQPSDQRSDDSHVINGGLAYLTSDRTQLDAFIGTGLNNTASDVFVGFGIAHLW